MSPAGAEESNSVATPFDRVVPTVTPPTDAWFTPPFVRHPRVSNDVAQISTRPFARVSQG
jgi:hypothetical protein